MLRYIIMNVIPQSLAQWFIAWLYILRFLSYALFTIIGYVYRVINGRRVRVRVPFRRNTRYIRRGRNRRRYSKLFNLKI